MTLFARLAVVAAVLPLAFATSRGPSGSQGSNCQSQEFYWNEKDCCLPYGGSGNAPSPPKGSSCPSAWEWSLEKDCCVPHQPTSSAPSCGNGWGWNGSKQCCEQPEPSTTPSKPTSSTPAEPSKPNTTTPSKPTTTKPSKPTPSTPTTTQPSTPTSSGSCGDNEWFWEPKSCCLPYGGSPNPPGPPRGSSCPSAWEWSLEQDCCVPHQPPSSTPSCGNGWGWNDSKKCCEQPAPSTQPSKPTSSTPATTEPAKPTPSTPTKTQPSTPTSSSSCGDNEWFWEPKSCCLPNGGNPNPPQPPSGRSCPSSWDWHDGKQCCVPHWPNPAPPQCRSSWGWDEGNKCCFPNSPTPPAPIPSRKPGNPGHGGHGWKRSHKARNVSLCPDAMTACPIRGLTGLSDDWECLDTTSELQSCGGCASTGAGQDCTAIDGAWNVGCKAGKCVVYTCAEGFLRSLDNKSCVKV